MSINVLNRITHAISNATIPLLDNVSRDGPILLAKFLEKYDT